MQRNLEAPRNWRGSSASGRDIRRASFFQHGSVSTLSEGVQEAPVIQIQRRLSRKTTPHHASTPRQQAICSIGDSHHQNASKYHGVRTSMRKKRRVEGTTVFRALPRDHSPRFKAVSNIWLNCEPWLSRTGSLTTSCSKFRCDPPSKASSSSSVGSSGISSE